MKKKPLLVIIPIFIILLGVLFTVIGTKSSVPVMYMQKGNVMVKARGKEPMPILKIEESYYGCGYVAENAVVYKEINGDHNVPGRLHYLSLSKKGAEPVSTEEIYIEHTETVGRLVVYNGEGLKIYNGKKNITVDTDVDDFCITPDKDKMLYWKRDGKVYVAKVSVKPEPELIFDMKKSNSDAYPVYCTPDLRQIIFKGGGDLYSYKNGKFEAIAKGVNYPSVVEDTIYFESNGKIYSYSKGNEREIDKNATMVYHYDCRGKSDEWFSTSDRYFKKDKLAIYSKNKKDMDYPGGYYLIGSDEPYGIEKGYHLACDGSYVYVKEIEGAIVRYSITSKGLKDRKELLQKASRAYSVDSNKAIAETDKGIYLITGGKCKRLSESCGNKEYEIEGKAICWLSEDNALYCNGKKICENVRNFDLRADGSLVWLTENDELYVKYKHCKPELIGNARGLYRVW